MGGLDVREMTLGEYTALVAVTNQWQRDDDGPAAPPPPSGDRMRRAFARIPQGGVN